MKKRIIAKKPVKVQSAVKFFDAALEKAIKVRSLKGIVVSHNFLKVL